MANHREPDGTYAMGFATVFPEVDDAVGQDVGRAHAESDDCPPWAAGVMRSVSAASREARAMTDYQEQVDRRTQLAFLAGPGVYVVPVEWPVTDERLRQAVDLLQRLRTHPLDLGALALADDELLPVEQVTDLADAGIVVAKTRGESARARAVAYVRQFLSQRAEGLANLERLRQAQARRAPQR